MEELTELETFEAAYAIKKDLYNLFSAFNITLKVVDRYEGRVNVLDLMFYGTDKYADPDDVQPTLLFTLKNVYNGVKAKRFLE